MKDATGALQLSILMPTIPSRSKIFFQLYRSLKEQVEYCKETHRTLGDVQILVDRRREFLKGGPSIGAKRQSLIERAKGNYLCFLDDDENISPKYVETLLRLCLQDKDVCTFRNVSKFDNYWCIVDMGLTNPQEQAHDIDIVYRKPWHICPVRREFASQYLFTDSNYGEDWVWFEKVLKHCTTEAKSNALLHQYNHSKRTSEADKIVNA
jgi:glycosyltransferase involved in cell wall biosynthesis